MNNTISKIAGTIFSIKFPKPIQKIINKGFIKKFKIELEEFYKYDSYRSLQELFTRKLKNLRVFSENENDFIAPADSKIIEYGSVTSDTLFQVKKVAYSVTEFLGPDIPEAYLDKLENGMFINFYLSPSDYHHFHAPTNLYIQKIIHIPGNLYPVKESYIKRKKVFSKNERVVLECKIQKNEKLLYFVAIGALNVGNIKIIKEPRIQTNTLQKNECTIYQYEQPFLVKKGEDIGYFSFGSSIVIVSEKESLTYFSDLFNKKIKFGENIGNI